MAYELPFGVELVRHGGILLEGRREAVGTGARGAARLGRDAPRVNGPAASRIRPVEPLKMTATTARAVIRVAGFHGA